ncbi:MAG: shikimate dehydrogenase [Mucilaginibacter polytrichastri]|nr:shikimate dehydrogenase [Mucilaginibacter polytrichastri]
MKKYGLIGFPLEHSFSKKYFTEKFAGLGLMDHSYDLFPIKNLSDLPALLRANPDLCGLNVTVPHKIGVMFYLDEVDTDAKKVDAVNCIRISSESAIEAAFSGELGIAGHDFKLEGFNTDVYGFEMSLKPLLKKSYKRALVLGNGGAARAVKYVLKKLGLDYTVVTRRHNPGTIDFGDLTREHMESHQVIINTTPLGTSPDIKRFPPIPYEYLTPGHLLYDLVYNPEVTAFLEQGKARGAETKNGFEMLELQAERSWELWNNRK